MKTASITAPMSMARNPSRKGLAKYLPHAAILALLFLLLLVASHNGVTTPPVNSSLTHLGPH